MMRISNKRFNERPSNIKKIKKKIFFAFEGLKTEEIYFSKLINKFNLRNNLPLCFYKDKENPNSNPKCMIDSLIDSVLEESDLSLTYESIKNLVIEACKNNLVIPDERKIESYVAKFANYKNESMNSPFDKKNIHEFVEYINKQIVKSNLNVAISELDFLETINFYSEYRSDIDEIYVICDRDKESFTEEQFLVSIEKCKNQNIELIVTTPCIEFWFLLHHTDGKQYDKKNIYENKKKSKNGDTYVYKLLKEKDSKYTKASFNADFYVEHLDVAIYNSKHYSSELICLKDNVGTMIPYFIQKINIE